MLHAATFLKLVSPQKFQEKLHRVRPGLDISCKDRKHILANVFLSSLEMV